jgi:aminoglycoside/choline kinase family phosphotransferase
LRWFDLMGVQRHLKALLTFSRKKVRDNQSQYLQHVPRTLNYLLMVTRNYPELLPMFEFLDHHVKPLCEKV